MALNSKIAMQKHYRGERPEMSSFGFALTSEIFQLKFS